MQNEARVVNLDTTPGMPPQGDKIADVKGKGSVILNFNLK